MKDYEKIPIEKLLNYELVDLMGLDIVTCSDCRYKDTGLCRCTKTIIYDLRNNKRRWKTLMEPDGFCSVGER